MAQALTRFEAVITRIAEEVRDSEYGFADYHVDELVPWSGSSSSKLLLKRSFRAWIAAQNRAQEFLLDVDLVQSFTSTSKKVCNLHDLVDVINTDLLSAAYEPALLIFRKPSVNLLKGSLTMEQSDLEADLLRCLRNYSALSNISILRVESEDESALWLTAV